METAQGPVGKPIPNFGTENRTALESTAPLDQGLFAQAAATLSLLWRFELFLRMEGAAKCVA
jgi:hypothetical protein